MTEQKMREFYEDLEMMNHLSAKHHNESSHNMVTFPQTQRVLPPKIKTVKVSPRQSIPLMNKYNN